MSVFKNSDKIHRTYFFIDYHDLNLENRKTPKVKFSYQVGYR